MIRCLVVLAGVLLCTSATDGGPIGGPVGKSYRLPAGTREQGKIVPGEESFSAIFRGGERACVTVVGDHNPVVEVAIKVYDSKNRLVIEDRGSGAAADFAAVIWYPARDENFRIVIESYGVEFNKCYVAVK